MSATKPVHVMQFRLTGPTEGVRTLKLISGPQKWRIHLWIKFPDGGSAEREILVSEPCRISALTPIYTREIDELCRDDSGEPATVTAGGADVYLMPRHQQPRPTPQRRRNAA